jgi:hypothetical protein
VKAFTDLTDLPEDERIDIIGRNARDGAVVGFVVEDDAKADRYVKKLLARHRVRLVSRGPGPVPNTILVTIGPVEH